MVGVSASGKTTASKTITKVENATRLSSDEIRLELIQKGILDQTTAFTPEGHDTVFQILNQQAYQLATQGKNILIDAQNIQIKHRRPYFEILKGFDCYFIAHVMTTDKAECERRYMQRDLNDCFYPFPVPKRKTMDDRFAMFEMPTLDEGFHEIRLVR